MAPTIEKIFAVTFRVANMTESVRFYKDVLGMELLYGGEDTGFSSLRGKEARSAILNLEQGDRVTRWGRLIFYVNDVDALWTHLKERGFAPEIPRDALRRTLLSHARSGRPRAVFCSSATMTWKESRLRMRPMAVSVEMQHTGDPSMQAEVRAVIEHVLADRPGEWRVSMMGSQANDGWEMKIVGPNAFERSYTLEGSAGEHRPETIRVILGRMLPGRKD
jgi:catechol 2,3-dioxygenase-like lactoylglutathione lyase family enzyme